jgi:hypothetical protein
MNWHRSTLFNRAAIVALLLLPHLTSAMDNIHFYRATNFFQEPRLEKEWLTSFDFTIGGGSTTKSRNQHGHKVPLLDIYGESNMQQLGIGVPGKDMSNPLDVLLTQLALLPSQPNFGVFSTHGKFNIVELNCSFTQNFFYGFFGQINLPVRKLEIHDICFQDLTPTTGYPNRSTPEWQAFLLSFNAILDRYCLSAAPFDRTGVGDLNALLGWTINYQDTDVIDYVDATFKVGVLCPTGKPRNENEIFSLPMGYNGHWGIPVSADISFGIYEWLTMGGHIEAMWFVNKVTCMHVKTAVNQSGVVMLASGPVMVEQGTQWAAGAYIKADHVIRGFSAILGYAFANQEKTTLVPTNDFPVDPCIVNSDQRLRRWCMHTLNFLVEYDFTKEDYKFGPRVGAFYNLQIGGKRIFKTSVGGASFGLEIATTF